MKTLYTLDKIPDNEKTIFLAGGTLNIKQTDLISWRVEAIKLFHKYKFDGTLYIPEHKGNILTDNWTYSKQIQWETTALNFATVIMFWIPRDKKNLPCFTTNVEFGEWYKSGKIVVGGPKDAYKNRYLQYKAKEYNVGWNYTLENNVQAAVTLCDLLYYN